jgi:hypothetical protein
LLNVRGSYYFLLASLAACVYYNFGALWVCAALLINYGVPSPHSLYTYELLLVTLWSLIVLISLAAIAAFGTNVCKAVGVLKVRGAYHFLPVSFLACVCCSVGFIVWVSNLRLSVGHAKSKPMQAFERKAALLFFAPLGCVCVTA